MLGPVVLDELKCGCLHLKCVCLVGIRLEWTPSVGSLWPLARRDRRAFAGQGAMFVGVVGVSDKQPTWFLVFYDLALVRHKVAQFLG